MMESKNNINFLISKLKHLPPLPESSNRIIAAVNDPDVSIEELTKVISASPVLVARLIGLANSAYFGRSNQIDDLRVAIIQVLGLNLVKSLALSVIVNMHMDVSQCKKFNGERFWFIAVVTATLAQKISVRLNNENLDPAIVYTIGLMLNIGLLTTIVILPEKLSEVLSNENDSDQPLSVRMSKTFGIDHYEVGFLLLKHWHLPEIYQTILAQYGNKQFQGDELSIIELIRLCSLIAKDLYFTRATESIVINNELEMMGLSEKIITSVVDGIIDKLDDLHELAYTINGN